MARTTIYQWAQSRGIIPQQAYQWRNRGLPTDAQGRVDPAEADEWLAARKRKNRTSLMTASKAHQVFTGIHDLRPREQEAIARSLASLGFLRAQGRTLARGSQESFCDFVWDVVAPNLDNIVSRSGFDNIHHRWIGHLCESLSTNKGAQLTYGQGQKSLNVFLKFFVDWSSQPSQECATRLRAWLHCPLDKVVMHWLASKRPEDYKERISRYYREVPPQQRYSLSKMDASAYQAWQAWIRELVPDKPVLLDVIWTFERAQAQG